MSHALQCATTALLTSIAAWHSQQDVEEITPTLANAEEGATRVSTSICTMGHKAPYLAFSMALMVFNQLTDEAKEKVKDPEMVPLLSCYCPRAPKQRILWICSQISWRLVQQLCRQLEALLILCDCLWSHPGLANPALCEWLSDARVVFEADVTLVHFFLQANSLEVDLLRLTEAESENDY